MVAVKLSSVILKNIVSRVVYGEIDGDGRLPSYKEMAAEFGASTVSVREATIILETLGILEIRHGSGIYVRDPVNLLEDVFRTREEIECAITREAARRINDEDILRMRKLVESLEEAAAVPSWDLYAPRDTAFHQAIIDISGLHILGSIVTVIRSAIFTPGGYRAIEAAKDPQYLLHANTLHWGIYESLAARDPEAAAESARKHLERVYSLWVNNFSEMRKVHRSEMTRVK